MIAYFTIGRKSSAIKYNTHEIRLYSADGRLQFAEPINFKDMEARRQMLLLRGIPEGTSPR